MSANSTAAASLASAASMVLLFEALPDALARRKVLDQLERAHVKLLARESAPELDDDQQTAAQVASLASQVHPESALPSRPPAAVIYTRTAPPGLNLNTRTDSREVAHRWKLAGYEVTPNPDPPEGHAARLACSRSAGMCQCEACK